MMILYYLISPTMTISLGTFSRIQFFLFTLGLCPVNITTPRLLLKLGIWISLGSPDIPYMMVLNHQGQW